MQPYKQHFIEFMVRAKVLSFGDFVTKSGRNTPFFVNTGRYRTGAQMQTLAGFYADAIVDSGLQFDVLFGPAYKGIPLVVATAMVLASRGHDVPFCFNRKEAKDHGEKGTLVGHTPKDGERALIIEDVTTAGTSIRETVPLLRAAANVTVSGLVVSVDRMERGNGTQSALVELQNEFSMRTLSIVTVREVMEYLRGRSIDGQVVLHDASYARMEEYLARYAATAAP